MDKKRGKYIDENFDIIVRFNNCIVDGYSEYVGSRIDYIYFSKSWIEFRKNYPNSKILLGDYNDNEINFDFIKINFYSDSLPKYGHFWSSGIHVIWHFLKESENEVYIHGICDGFENHYWDTDFKVFAKHDLSVEHDLISKWNIKRLSSIF